MCLGVLIMCSVISQWNMHIENGKSIYFQQITTKELAALIKHDLQKEELERKGEVSWPAKSKMPLMRNVHALSLFFV